MPSRVDTGSMNSELAKKVEGLEQSRSLLATEYKNEKQVKVQGSPMYAPWFGKNMPIVLNGIAIYVPLDGQGYNIPESFAAIFNERISLIDEQERRRKAMANVQANLESYAGELSLVSPA